MVRLPVNSVFSTLLVATALACGDVHTEASRAAGRSSDDGLPLAAAAVTGHLARHDLVESSGLAASATQPGVLFTINDSGNEPVLYAIDSSGADRGAWTVAGAEDVDWESIAVGPCGGSGGPGTVADGVPRCVYIGDTGDNLSRHHSRTVYRVPEPAAAAAGSSGTTAPAEALEYVYDGGPRDVEAMTVGPAGEISLYTKRPHSGADGRLRPSLIYRLPAAAWAGPRPARAALADSLPPVVPGAGSGGSLVTDASLSPDGRRLAVRTYTQLWLFPADSATGRVRHAPAPLACDLSPLEEDVGEGATWLDSARVVLASEGRGAAVHVVRCAAPGAAR